MIMKKREIVPTEYQEQLVLVEWLEFYNFKFTAIPNSTYTPSMKQKVMNRRMGLRPGLPDLLIVVGGHLLFIELKRTKGSVTSSEQKAWIEALNKVDNVQAFIAYGAEEAIAIVEKYAPPTRVSDPLADIF